MAPKRINWTPGCAAKLRELRTERGLYQKVLSRQCGLSRSRIAQMESPRRPIGPSPEALRRLCEELGVAQSDLLVDERGVPAQPRPQPANSIRSSRVRHLTDEQLRRLAVEVQAEVAIRDIERMTARRQRFAQARVRDARRELSARRRGRRGRVRVGS